MIFALLSCNARRKSSNHFSLRRALPDGVIPQLERVVESVFGYTHENAKKLIVEILLCVRRKELVGH